MMDQLTKLVEFLAAYPAWVKYSLIGLLFSIIVLLVVFRPTKNGISSHWKLRVYHFENLGEAAKQNQTGERFSGRILDDLLRRQLDAKQGTERMPPTDIFQFRGDPPQDLLTAYRQLAPFVCVSGFVDEGKSKQLTAHVRVSRIDADLHFEPLLARTYELSADESNWDAITQSIGEEIFGSILKMPR